MILLNDILAAKSPGKIYEISYDDVLGNQTTIELYLTGYTGTVGELILSDPPLIIKQFGDGDEINVGIRGTEATLNIICQTNFEFFNILQNAGEYDLRLDILKHGKLYWRGWVVPDIYSENLTCAPYEISLKAVDGLALLKNYDFHYSDTEKTPYEITSLITILAWILSRTYSGLEIVDATNIFPDTFTGNSPLADLCINTWIFKGDDLYTILQKIIEPNYRIVQSEGRWVIYRPSLVCIDGHIETVYPYDISSSVENSDVSNIFTVVPIESTGTNTITPIDRSVVASYAGAVRNLTIKNNLKLRESITGRGNFDLADEWNAGILDEWTEVNAGAGLSYYYEHDNITDDDCVVLKDEIMQSGAIIDRYGIKTNSIYNIVETDQYLKIKLKIRGYTDTGTIEKLTFFVMVILNNTYYLDENGEWTVRVGDAFFIEINNTSFNDLVFYSKQVFPVTGTLEIRLLTSFAIFPIGGAPVSFTTYTVIGSCFITLQNYTLEGDRIANEDYDYPSEVSEANTLNANVRRDLEIVNNYNEGTKTYGDWKNIYGEWLSTSGSEITGFNENTGASTWLTLIEFMRLFFTRQFRYSRVKLYGTFYGNLRFCAVITDKWLNGKKLTVNSLELNDKYCQWTGEFLEIVENYFWFRCVLGVSSFTGITLQGTLNARISIYWGDGTIDDVVLTGGLDNVTHSFSVGTFIVNMSGELDQLTYLKLESNAINEIFEPGYPNALTNLYISDNVLTAMNLDYIPRSVERLFAENNQIAELEGSVQGNNLEVLNLTNNYLTAFDFTKVNEHLGELRIGENNITVLSGTMNANMSSITANNNGMTTLTIVPCNQLLYADFTDNAITSFDDFLIYIDNKGATNGYLHLTGGTNQAESSLSGLGKTAHDNLVTKGWTIDMN